MSSQYSQQHTQQKQSRFGRRKALTAAGALLVVVGIGATTTGCGKLFSGGDDKTKSADKSAENKSTEKSAGTEKGGKSEKKSKKAAFSGNGTLQVGSDIKPGTYMSVGNSEFCYWERLKNSSGDAEAINANDTGGGTAYVTITANDKLFKTQSCAGWNPMPTAKSGTPKSEISGSGMYRVGVDIAPGTYKFQGGTTCYWERTKDALHGTDSILANDNVTGNGIVTISPDDAYFKTNGCTNWKKSG